METQEVTDMMGRLVRVPAIPRRIVSVVPSQTELLYDLGLNDPVVGITKFCVHPEAWYRGKPRVGGTKTLSKEKIADLQPDLILANKEENDRENIFEAAGDTPVWFSDIFNLSDSFRMIREVGQICNVAEKANHLVGEIAAEAQKFNPIFNEQRCLYLIWKNPYMAAGSNTFIHDMLLRCGLRNLAPDPRYGELTHNEISELNPDIILLSSEPFPFKEVHRKELKGICPNAEVMLVDGEMFSWYGSRLKLAFRYFESLKL